LVQAKRKKTIFYAFKSRFLCLLYFCALIAGFLRVLVAKQAELLIWQGFFP